MKLNSILFWIFFCGLLGDQMIASEMLISLSTQNFQDNTITLQSSDQCNDMGIIFDCFNQIKLDVQRQIMHNVLCARVHRNMYESGLECHEVPLQTVSDWSKLQRQLSIILLFLCNFGYQELYSSVCPPSMRYCVPSFEVIERSGRVGQATSAHTQQAVVVEQDDVPFGCGLHNHLSALPVMYATNILGNLAAIGVTYVAPTPLVGCVAGGTVGCVGGCIESVSANDRYLPHTVRDSQRNFFTGYVADQLTGTVGTCFRSPTANAAAVGSLAGYGCGLGTGLAVRACYERQYRPHDPVEQSARANDLQVINR